MPAVAATPISPNLIHQRLGHIGSYLMEKVKHQYDKLTAIPSILSCETCQISKAQQRSFSFAERTTRPLQRLHLNTIGPIAFQSDEE